ncbi:type I-C CRISPR-associated endonuclease Cas1c [Neisseria iguanae]|uniref:CRISPR-associated endonuclease Cas1 n=1 Tax=Neisseria iguanae TaxID=90242 RepID=A0A2P7U134_9NEIS|nr:type I-C CRISPR-associated endonuclease Cas1c [Neisseria iguanae]PSJ80692.1 subtype I-C CRISPR-associated endonuclease Cas1 [Neisseria iguanae]
MRKLQNTLYITTQGTYLHKERETLVIEKTVEGERQKLLQLPVHSIAHIFCFGNVLVSPFFMGFCGENNVNLAFFTENGRYLGRLQGRQSGNVLLRQAQYRQSEHNPVAIARNIIAAKIQSSKRVLQRRLRNHGEHAEVQTAITALNFSLSQLQRADNLELIRGIEGDAASRYFGVFQHLLTEKCGFVFNGRNRRPPRDPVNALLSFLYSVLGRDIGGALQSVGLDPQVGFLHADRPGRDSLAQDMLEEFRAWWVDRMVLSLINRGQIKPADFETEASGAVNIKADTRKLIFQTLQAKKQEKIIHPYLQEEVEIGLLPYIQAMLLARHLRGDLAEYPPFLMR